MSLTIRLMTDADVPLGLRLKRQAGWNQTLQDWRRWLLLEHEGCFVAEWDGAPVATTITCVFGPVAWVAMVLVEEAHRGRGIGTALMRHALAYLDRRGVRTVRLDATPLGRPVYEKLGFVGQFTLARYEGPLPERQGGRAATLTPYLVNELLARDQGVTGTERGRLLTLLYLDQPLEWLTARDREGRLGYAGLRGGTRALQVGPCLASAESGAALLDEMARRHAGANAYLDIPTDHADAVRWAEDAGLTVQHPLLRMCRGEPVREDLTQLWTSAGPEVG